MPPTFAQGARARDRATRARALHVLFQNSDFKINSSAPPLYVLNPKKTLNP
jgi:hypothetical protein